jgi:hypothetical protein
MRSIKKRLLLGSGVAGGAALATGIGLAATTQSAGALTIVLDPILRPLLSLLLVLHL